MTTLRQRMTEDMQVRNLAPNTQTSYVQQVSLFARHFNKSPEAAGSGGYPGLSGLPDQRKEAGPWFRSSSLSPPCASSTRSRSRRTWPFDEVIPAPKKPQKLPVVLSPEEVLQFLEMRRQHQASCDPDHLLRRRPTHLRSRPPEARRHRQPANGHPCRAGQGAERSLRDALAETAGDPARLLADHAAEGVALSGRRTRPANHQKRRGTGLPEGPPHLRHRQADNARILCGTPSPSICWNPAPMSAPFNCCWAIAAWRPRPATCGSPPARSAPPPVRWICCRVPFAAEPSPLRPSTSERQGPWIARNWKWRTSSAVTAQPIGRNMARRCRLRSDAS